MKRGYKRLLVFELIIFIFLILNSFVSSILSNYGMVIFLVILLGIFKITFNFEKDRHRFTKDIIFETIIFLLIFFLLFYLSGLIISFARTGDYYTLKNIFTFIIPTIITIVLREFLRYNILNKADGSKLLTVLTCIMFIFIETSNVIYYQKFNSTYNVFIFLALTLLPAISKNIAATYITKMTGYKPLIIYFWVMELYQYLIPIIPNPNEYLISIITIILPALYARRVYLFFKKDRVNEEVIREKYRHQGLSLILPTILIIIIVYLTSGYFRFKAVAIASGSMTPMIHKGDVVIIDKNFGSYDNLIEGQIIAYNYENTLIVHRLVAKIKFDDKYYFYTKGDANRDRDNYEITEDMIVGTVNLKIPYLGIPTVFVNEL